MISPQEYITTISARLQEKFPDDPVAPYENLVPMNFSRPSCSVECEEVEFSSVGLNAAEARLVFVIRTFVETDAYHNSHFAELYRRAATIYGAFIRGSLRVKDPDDGHERAPKITKQTAKIYNDYAEVRMETSLQMDLEEFEAVSHGELMQQLHTRMGYLP